MEEILIEYAKETIYKGNLYFIADKSLEEDYFVVYEYEEDDDNIIKVMSDELPENTTINSVFRKNDDKYILDGEDTSIVKAKIDKMIEEVLNEQNEALNEYRKEDHTYIITERINDRIFLKDITDNLEEEIEEINFPEELLEKAFEGKKFIYINNDYKMIN